MMTTQLWACENNELQVSEQHRYAAAVLYTSGVITGTPVENKYEILTNKWKINIKFSQSRLL